MTKTWDMELSSELAARLTQYADRLSDVPPTSEPDASKALYQEIQEICRLLDDRFQIEIKERNYKNLFSQIRAMDRPVKKISRLAMSDQTKSHLYAIGIFARAYHAYKWQIDEMEKVDRFTLSMVPLIHRAHIPDILKILLQDDFVQNKNLSALLEIKPNLLNKCMKQLLEVGCVNRLPYGKEVFYSLSAKGRRYAQEKFENEDFVRDSTFPLSFPSLYTNYRKKIASKKRKKTCINISPKDSKKNNLIRTILVTENYIQKENEQKNSDFDIFSAYIQINVPKKNCKKIPNYGMENHFIPQKIVTFHNLYNENNLILQPQKG